MFQNGAEDSALLTILPGHGSSDHPRLRGDHFARGCYSPGMKAFSEALTGAGLSLIIEAAERLYAFADNL